MPKARKKDKRDLQAKLFIFCEGEKTEPNYFEEMIKALRIPPQRARVAVDLDGYTKHADCFERARHKNVSIALSCVSFEFWVLLHFEYTTKCFAKADDVIRRLKHEHGLAYAKNMQGLYSDIADKEPDALDRAKKLRKHHKDTGGGKPYECNPCTEVDLLVKDLHKAAQKAYGVSASC